MLQPCCWKHLLHRNQLHMKHVNKGSRLYNNKIPLKKHRWCDTSYIQFFLMLRLFLLCTSCSPFVPGTECVSRTPSSAAVTETGAVPSPPCFQWWYRPTRVCAGATKQRSDYEPYQPWGMACKWALHYRFWYYSELLMSFYFLISSTSGPQTNCLTKQGLKKLVICLCSVVWMSRSLNDNVFFDSVLQKPIALLPLKHWPYEEHFCAFLETSYLLHLISNGCIQHGRSSKDIKLSLSQAGNILTAFDVMANDHKCYSINDGLHSSAIFFTNPDRLHTVVTEQTCSQQFYGVTHPM